MTESMQTNKADRLALLLDAYSSLNHKRDSLLVHGEILQLAGDTHEVEEAVNEFLKNVRAEIAAMGQELEHLGVPKDCYQAMQASLREIFLAQHLRSHFEGLLGRASPEVRMALRWAQFTLEPDQEELDEQERADLIAEAIELVNVLPEMNLSRRMTQFLSSYLDRLLVSLRQYKYCGAGPLASTIREMRAEYEDKKNDLKAENDGLTPDKESFVKKAFGILQRGYAALLKADQNYERTKKAITHAGEVAEKAKNLFDLLSGPPTSG